MQILYIDTNLRLILLEHTVHTFLLLFKVLYLYNLFNKVMPISSLWNIITKCLG